MLLISVLFLATAVEARPWGGGRQLGKGKDKPNKKRICETACMKKQKDTDDEFKCGKKSCQRSCRMKKKECCQTSCKMARTSCKKELVAECETRCNKGPKSNSCKECKKNKCKQIEACEKARACKKPKAL